MGERDRGRSTMNQMQASASRSFKVVVERDTSDDVWVTYVPALGNLSTYGDTRDDALNQTRDAILGYLEAAAKEGIPLPPANSVSEVVDLR